MLLYRVILNNKIICGITKAGYTKGMYKDKEKQREYMRELMKKRRVKGVKADGRWDVEVKISGELYEMLEKRAKEKGQAVSVYIEACLRYILIKSAQSV